MKPDFPFILHLNEPVSLEWLPKKHAIVIKTKSGKEYVIDYENFEVFYTKEGKDVTA